MITLSSDVQLLRCLVFRIEIYSDTNYAPIGLSFGVQLVNLANEILHSLQTPPSSN
jgi:hypothetical protein